MKEDVCRDMIRYNCQWQGKQLADLAKVHRYGDFEEEKTACAILARREYEAYSAARKSGDAELATIHRTAFRTLMKVRKELKGK